jgi:hypothetical protein
VNYIWAFSVKPLDSLKVKNATYDFYFCTVHVVTFTLLKTNSCTYFKVHFHIHIKTLKLVKKVL